MIIKYKNYMGTVESIERINMSSKYSIAIRDYDNIIIKFVCDIHDIKIPDVVANSYLLGEK